jgi:hypothetical protein
MSLLLAQDASREDNREHTGRRNPHRMSNRSAGAAKSENCSRVTSRKMMPWFSRAVLSYVLAVIILTGAAVITPDTVLCVGPAGHYHLEIVVGTGCTRFVPGLTGPKSPGSQPTDGCPKGSKDFRLSVDSQRADNTRATVAHAAIMLVASGVVEVLNASYSRVRWPLSTASQSRHSRIVLRC